jgi:hypothetical protein
MLMPSQWFIKSIDPDGKRSVSDVYKEVYKISSMYYDLVVTRNDEGLYYFPNALEIYESFVWITRNQHGASILPDVHAVITAQTVCGIMCS